MIDSNKAYLSLRFFVVIALICLVSVFVYWLLIQCGYGLGITDEGYYLNVISDPSMHRFSATNFGVFYAPIFEAINHSIPTLRVMNVLSLYLLSVYLCYQVLAPKFESNCLSRFEVTVLSMAFGTSVFVFFNLWLPTPSYNSLNLLGVLISVSAILKLNKGFSGNNYSSAIILGLGGALVFLAKPSSAAMLALIVLSLLVYLRAFVIPQFRLLIFIFVASLASGFIIALAAYSVDGSIVIFIQNLMKGAEVASLTIGDSWNFSHILWHGNLNIDNYIFAACTLLACITLLAANYLPFHFLISKRNHFLCLLFLLLLIAIAFTYILGINLRVLLSSILWQKRSSLFLIVWPSLFMIFAFLSAFSSTKQYAKQPLPSTPSGLVIFTMPYVIAFGTTNNYFNAMALFPFFGVLAILFIYRPSKQIPTLNSLYPFAVLVLFISFLAVYQGLERPYRQFSWLNDNNTKTLDLNEVKGLKLNSASSRYMETLYKEAMSAGFAPNTPLIDLTGASPGVNYILSAKPLGAFWLLGGYSGSDSMALINLRKHNNEVLKRAWILTEPESVRSLSLDTLEELNLNLSENYTLVLSVSLPVGFAGRRTANIQNLYKPTSM